MRAKHEFKVGETVIIHERAFDPADCKVMRVTEKAVLLKSVYLSHESWFPKGWLVSYKPEDESYAGEFYIPKWVELSKQQEKVVNISE